MIRARLTLSTPDLEPWQASIGAGFGIRWVLPIACNRGAPCRFASSAKISRFIAPSQVRRMWSISAARIEEPALGRLGRRRGDSLLLSWLEVRWLGSMRRATSGRSWLCAENSHSQFSDARVSRADLRLLGRRGAATVSDLSTAGTRGHSQRRCLRAQLQLFRYTGKRHGQCPRRIHARQVELHQIWLELGYSPNRRARNRLRYGHAGNPARRVRARWPKRCWWGKSVSTKSKSGPIWLMSQITSPKKGRVPSPTAMLSGSAAPMRRLS